MVLKINKRQIPTSSQGAKAGVAAAEAFRSDFNFEMSVSDCPH